MGQTSDGRGMGKNQGNRTGHWVSVCQDHQLYTDGLRRVLVARGMRVDSCSDPQELVELVRLGEQLPSMVITGLRGGDPEWAERVRYFRKRLRGTKVVVLTSFADDTRLVEDLVDAGAHGVISKAASAEEICELVLRLLEGASRLVMDRETALQRVVALRRQEEIGLTPRERAVLELLGRNVVATKEIAAALLISPNTVKPTLRRLYAKLGASTRIEAIETGIEAGLVRTTGSSGGRRTVPVLSRGPRVGVPEPRRHDRRCGCQDGWGTPPCGPEVGLCRGPSAPAA